MGLLPHAEVTVSVKMGPYGMRSLLPIFRPLSASLVFLALGLMVPAVVHAQWPHDTVAAGRGGAAGALVGHLSPLRPAQLPESGSGIQLSRAVPLGVGALATSSASVWHARTRWTGSMGVDTQSFDAWSALRPYLSASALVSGSVHVGVTAGAERERLGQLGHRVTPLLVVGMRTRLAARFHMSAYAVNSRAADRQGARASIHISAPCVPCRLIGHATWRLHPREGSLWSAGAQWLLSRWLSVGMGLQSVPVALGFSVRVVIPYRLAAHVAALSHHNTAPTHSVSGRATRGPVDTQE